MTDTDTARVDALAHTVGRLVRRHAAEGAHRGDGCALGCINNALPLRHRSPAEHRDRIVVRAIELGVLDFTAGSNGTGRFVPGAVEPKPAYYMLRSGPRFDEAMTSREEP